MFSFPEMIIIFLALPFIWGYGVLRKTFYCSRNKHQWNGDDPTPDMLQRAAKYGVTLGPPRCVWCECTKES